MKRKKKKLKELCCVFFEKIRKETKKERNAIAYLGVFL
jgi:hypothetical protein